MSTAEQVGSLAVAELVGLSLGRKGRAERAVDLLAALARDPTQSIRAAARKPSEEEAFYRFLNNDAIGMDALLKPHLLHTAERCQKVKKVICPNDTSNFEYKGGKREGLGRVRTKTSQGFLFHASLAIDASTGQPLGMLASKIWVRSDELTSVVEGKNGPRKKSGRDYARMEHKESDRWVEQMKAAAEQLGYFGGQLIHVADREADIFAALAELRKLDYSFVIRLARDKKARETGDSPLEDLTTLARKAEGRLEVQAPIAARASTSIPGLKKTFAEREARTARLEFAAISAQIEAPKYAEGSLPINVVHVREIDTPDGQEPIEWFLLTSEPVDTIEQVTEVVQAYRTRWIIEEFFKALKTGCAMEDRELESLHTLTNVLALCIPIAYQLLAVRHLARTAPSAPASEVFTPTQIEVLQAKTKLGPNPSVLQGLQAVAYLGSHFAPFSKKMPGWQVLSRGMKRLLALEEGWLAREAAQKVIER